MTTRARHGERKKQVLDLHEKHPDWTYSKLAKAAGTTAPTVRAICYRAGVKVPTAPSSRRLTAADHRDLAEYHLRRAREIESERRADR